MNRLLIVASTLVVGLAVAMTHGAEVYVSPQGNDADPGTLDKPLKTLDKARQAVRTLKTAGSVTVWLRGGRYELTEPLVLGPEDSGQRGRPVVYRAYAQERPVLSGGRAIGGWKKVEGDLPGLPEAAKGKVWAAAVPDVKDGKWYFRQLWADGKRLTRARWPNESEARFRVTDASTPPAKAAQDPKVLDAWRLQLQQSWKTAEVHADDLKALPGAKLPSDLGDRTAELFCKIRGRWATMRIPIEKADGSRLITAMPMGCLSYYWGGLHLMSPAANTGYVENALSLLDKPGEWFLDRKAGLVYYLPRDGEDPNALEFIAPRAEQLLCIRGTSQAPVRFVELRGLWLQHAEWPLPAFGYRPTLGGYYGTQLTPLVANVPIPPGSVRPKDEHPEFCLPAAVELTYAKDCLLELCRVGHVGASGIGLGEGCRQNRVVGCEVSDAGGHGIHAGMSHGPVCGEDFAWKSPDDEPQANEICNCYVHHNGHMDWGSYGIFSSYCRGNRIAHNLVEQQPYSGICTCFTWFAFPSGRDEEVTVEYNHIHHVMLKLFDGGAIYTKDGVAKTSVLRGNLLHDIGGGSTMNNGVFLDDRSYGFHLVDNIIYGVTMPVRFNGTSKEKFTWGTNYFGVKDFPRELAEKAGPKEPYRSLLIPSR